MNSATSKGDSQIHKFAQTASVAALVEANMLGILST